MERDRRLSGVNKYYVSKAGAPGLGQLPLGGKREPRAAPPIPDLWAGGSRGLCGGRWALLGLSELALYLRLGLPGGTGVLNLSFN